MGIGNLNVLGYPVFDGKLTEVDWSTPKLTVNTINQYSYCIAHEDDTFSKALKASDILLPDGVGIVWAATWLRGEKINKIAGADIHEYLLKHLQGTGGRCFYMGSSNTVLEKIKKRAGEEYPNITVGTYSPPYKPEFTPEDNAEILTAINSFSPDVVFVGMTAPKQEKWVDANAQFIDKGIICSIGAVFDFYAGTVQRPGKVWQNLGLEWLGRFVKEPKRMFRRYFYYGVIFAYHLVARTDKKKGELPAHSEEKIKIIKK
ncbi:WecB/TagA/CpsF family glycosyltransferase [Zobellia roscoffensis]|uniref:WecB/TagA/CpsF family glycosyltransferase n=1 Tax=Zobellia roscoffensis TaxID=2779508 RepID=UPI00188D5779|nr:WecB/TagA/CpsF family glycosyltransferase [Zobellia roscoffensis]